MLVSEIQDIVVQQDGNDDLFSSLINSGLLPKYAFPVDVVSLNIPTEDNQNNDNENGDSGMQEILKIALAEYAPGQVVAGNSQTRTFTNLLRCILVLTRTPITYPKSNLSNAMTVNPSR